MTRSERTGTDRYDLLTSRGPVRAFRSMRWQGGAYEMDYAGYHVVAQANSTVFAPQPQYTREQANVMAQRCARGLEQFGPKGTGEGGFFGFRGPHPAYSVVWVYERRTRERRLIDAIDFLDRLNPPHLVDWSL